jgi:hypothetical protein
VAGHRYDRTVRIGRDVEKGRIDDLIDDVRARRGGALVVRGEAGVGKSALLEHAAGAAHDLRILRATGIQSEAELAFATLHALLHPLAAELESLPRPQADALRSDLALGPSAPGDAFATFAGVLGLLVAAADRQPVLVLLDDAHLVDRSSAHALGFALRRLRDEPVGVLLAIRDGEPSTFDTEDLPELVVTALGDDHARELLSHIAPATSPDGLRRILELARGNPLALLELPTLVGPDEPTADAQHDPPRTSVLLSRAFGRRIEGLPEATRTALVVSAASDDNRLNLILRASGSSSATRSCGRRLLEAARAAEEAGRLEVSVALAEEAGRLTTNDLEAAEIVCVLGRATARLGEGGDAVEILTGAAERARAIDPERAALMLALEANPAVALTIDTSAPTWPPNVLLVRDGHGDSRRRRLP